MDNSNPTHAALATPDEAEAAVAQRWADPGLPAHVHRTTDIDPRAARRAERQVAALFGIAILGAIAFLVFYLVFPLDSLANIAHSRLALGLCLGFALFAIGAGAVQWAKKLMPDEEIVEERHAIASTQEERQAAADIILEGGEATGFGRRKLIWGTLVGALGALAIPAIVPLRDLWVRKPGDPSPPQYLRRTAWAKNTRLVTDPEGRPIKPEEVPIGSVVHIVPDGIDKLGENPLNVKAKAAVLLIRMEPEEIVEPPDRKDWSYNGLVAYSEICTHVGCPVALYEQTTHHVLCPCHQSTFDVSHGAKVVFGPAHRPLPQLAITVDEEGYLVAQHDFLEPIGPSFWERAR